MLQTLNGLQVGRFKQTKPLLVVAYVALEGPTPRRQVAELLWPAARRPDSSLRVALHSLRQHEKTLLDGDDPLCTHFPCDALHLLSTCGLTAGEHYPGPFLNGVTLGGVSGEFEEWVYAQRERLAGHVQAQLLQAAQGQPPVQAAALAEQVYRLPGAPAPTPERLAHLLTLSLPGSPLETELRHELESVEELTPPHAPAPARRGRLLGREAELAMLLDWAGNDTPGGRVALISGLGGIGKSSLAAALLRELGDRGRATTFVNAEPLRTPSEVISAVTLAQPRTPPHQLAPGDLGRWLGDPHVILLDGVDQLQDLPYFLTGMVQTAPNLRWVLTGRRSRLGLPRPTHLHDRQSGPATLPGGLPLLSVRLSGLPTPEAGDALPDLHASHAVQLFLREAGRFQRDLRLTPENAPLIASLTRRLQGHPLALTLAAAWLGREPLPEVHARVLRSLTDPQGQRGNPMTLLAQQAWTLLSPAAQRAAVQLSPFVDFDPARLPAYGIPDEVTDELLEHAFLEAYRPGSERLRLYPALSEFARAQAAQDIDILTQADAGHSEHFLTWFEMEPFDSPSLTEELGNLLRAAEHAARHGTLTEASTARLMAFYDARAQPAAGYDTLSLLSDLLYEHDAPEGVQAAAQIGQMWLALKAGLLLDAQTLAMQFLDSPLSESPLNRLKALNTLASVRRLQGQMRIAADLQEQALALAREMGDEGREALHLKNLLECLIRTGEFARVQTVLPGAEALAQKLNSLQLQTNFIWIRLELPDPNYEDILAAATNLRTLARQSGQEENALWLAYYSSRCQLGLKQHRAALEGIRSVVAQVEAKEDWNLLCSAYLLQARLLYLTGRSKQARRSVLLAVQKASEVNSALDIFDALLVVAPDVGQHHPAETRKFLSALAGDERTCYQFQQEAKRFLKGDGEAESSIDHSELAQFLLRLLN